MLVKGAAGLHKSKFNPLKPGDVNSLSTDGCKDIKKPILADNWPVSQMRAPLAACREPTGKLWQLCKVLYVFEHKKQYILIHAPYTRIVVFWHIGKVPPMIS